MLKVNFDTFRWYRPKAPCDRFRWSDENDPLLLAGGRGCREYSPKTYKGLFRRFASLGAHPGKILAFANQFGLLVGRSPADRIKRKLRPGEDWPIDTASMGCHGPSTFRLSDWVTSIGEMKGLVDLVELLTNDCDHPNKARRVADPVKNRDEFLCARAGNRPGPRGG